MCTGSKYAPVYVTRLQAAVTRNLELEHRFVCITEHRIKGVETMAPPTDLPGWWGKIGLFKPGALAGECLWLDLDVVITGALDKLVQAYANCVLATPWNWAQSGHGGCQSSVMRWNAGLENGIYSTFMQDPQGNMRRLWGDQEFITERREAGLPVTRIHEDLVVSYKYHCQEGRPPANARVVVFHGKPDPHEVNDTWVRQCWA